MMKTGPVSNLRARLKWDTFLSFQKDPNINSFTERLYDAFVKEEVRVWNEEVESEDDNELSQSVVDAIEDSVAFVVVLSPTYAKSHLRLEELAMFCDLRTPLKRPLIPIFYKVEPWHVREHLGPFEKDFEEHSKRFGKDKVVRWKEAMTLAGSISGLICGEDSVKVEDNTVGKKEKKEDENIGLVVKRVLEEVTNTPEKVGEYTVGLDSRIQDLMKLLEVKSSSGVQILGLYGMGGIGKTTLAKAFYNKIISNFEDHRVFISNVREKSSDQNGLVDLQKTFIKGLFRGEPEIEDVNQGVQKIRASVDEKKVIVVLDDVDKIDQLNALVGEQSWYGKGSLLVITSRNQEIFNSFPVNQQYEVKCLSEIEALQLFSFHSLGKEKPTENLLEISKKIVQISGLLPLAVEVFGSLLYDKKDVKDWQTQLEKLKNTQPNNLQDILLLSFESLQNEEKIVFLDIACLFLKMEITIEEVVDVLKGCGFDGEAALNVLRQKSFVKIKYNDTLWMHDQIRDMGMQMVLNENREDPEMRSRLWDRGEILNVLNYMKGTTSTQGIIFDYQKKFARDPTAAEIASTNLHNNPITIESMVTYMRNKFISFPAEEKPKSCEITIPVKTFAPMDSLRLLQINHVELEGDLKLLPSKLKWLQWKGCPLKNVPPVFLAGQFAVLDLSESGITQVQSPWNKRVEGSLKVVNLRGCHSLDAIPDLSNHKALEKLILQRCKLLVKVPRSVGNLENLLHLDLRDCSELSEFRIDVSRLKSLKKLFLSGCYNLSVLPKDIGAMPCLKELLLDGTAIKNLPESIDGLQNLEKLSLRGCRSIQKIPDTIGQLASLEKLDLGDTALQKLPDTIGNLKNLKKLYLVRCTSLFKIPYSINDLELLKELVINGSAVEELPLEQGSLPCLTDFSAGDCKFLKQVPCSINGLNSLFRLQLDNTPIETLPKEIGGLHFIQQLELRNCKSLKVLPESIGDMDLLEKLYLTGSNIEELPESFGKLKKLDLLQMNNCKMLKRLPESFGDLESLYHLYMQETSVTELPESFGNLSKLIVLKMLKKPLFRSPKNDFPSTGKELPNSFSNLLLLEEMDARSWGISGKIPDAFEKLSHVRILNLGNNCFDSLPASLEGLSILTELSMYDCRELKSLPPLPSSLEQLNLANCFALESISDLSKLEVLHELNLTNCDKVDKIPGLKHLKALKRLYMSGCNSKCSLDVKKRLSKASLKMMRNLSLPGDRIPEWFSQGPLTFSAHPNRELKGVILAVVVALDSEIEDDYQLPDVVEVQAQILKLDLTSSYTHTLHLSGVSRTSNDQLHICRYSVFHPMVTMLKDGYNIQVIKRNPPFKQGVELKKHGIYLVYEGEDDVKEEERNVNENEQTVSQKLANFFSS